MGCHFLLQGIFPTRDLNPGLPHCRQTLYCLSYQGSSWLVRESPQVLYLPADNLINGYTCYSTTYHYSWSNESLSLVSLPHREDLMSLFAMYYLCSVLWAPLVRHFISVREEPQNPEEGSSEVSYCSKGIHQNKCMLKARIYETLEFLGCWLNVCHVISQIINSPMSSIILISHSIVILTTNSFKRLVFYINTTMGIKEKGGAYFSLWKEIIMDSVLYLMGL